MAQGVGPEDRVGICLERGIDLVAAVLGIFKTGAAYVPLDPNYPAERLAWMARDANLKQIVTKINLNVEFSGNFIAL